MTICSKMYEALDKRLEEKKSLDEIGAELCDAVIDPRGKAIRLIKQSKGEKYLKDNAEWLGYQVNSIDCAIETNEKKREKIHAMQEYQDLRDDARSNGLRVDAPIYGMSSGATIQSMQDEFEPGEIVYEKNTDTDGPETSGDSCSFGPIPLKEVLQERNAICPCGCGYGYDEEKRKWYTQKQMEKKHVI